MTQGHGTRGTQWLWSRYSQDLAESKLLKQRLHFLPKRQREHKAPNNLFNICNLSRLGGHCLSKRLDIIFDPSRVLYEDRQL